MTAKPVVLTAVIFLVLFSAFSMADQMTTLIIWIEGTLGVNGEYNSLLNVTLGETAGTWFTIHNTGNIRDVLRMEGQLVGEPGYTDWVKFSFKCAESVGICDDIPSSDRKYVDEIQLTPKINQTRFYVEVTGYKVVPVDAVNLTITGYSLTNFTKQTDFAIIGINVTVSEGANEAAELPGINPVWLPLLLVFSGIIFYKKMA